MVLPTSRPLGMYDIRNEIRGPGNTAQIGLTDTNVRTLAGRQGAVSVNMPVDFFGKSVTPVPVANFNAIPTSGVAPLTVNFYDTSSNSPTSWEWDFTNDGTVDSTAKNTSYTYTTAGTYSVKLKATNAGGSDTITKVNHINVSSPSSVKVAIFGDSVSTYGGATLIPGQPPGVDSSYNTSSQDGSITYVIQKLYPNYTVINVSRGGMTTREALGQVPSLGNNPFGSSVTITQWITDNSPSKIILRYGLAEGINYPYDTQTAINNLNNIIIFAQNLGIEVILIGVNHAATPDDPVNPGYYGPTYTNYDQINAVAEIGAGIASLASTYNLKYANPRAITAPPKSLPDGIHPYRNFGFKITKSILSQLRQQVPTSEQGSIPTQTYEFISPLVGTTVTEGASVSFTVQTTGVGTGTTLWWAASSDTGAQPQDVSFPSPAPLGSVTVNSQGQATITITVATDDATPEVDESFYVEIYATEQERDSFVNQLAMSNVVYVNNITYNEVITPAYPYVYVGDLLDMEITGGRPGAAFSWNRNWVGQADIQYGNLDQYGSFLFDNLIYSSVGYYGYTFTFGTAPNTRTRNAAVTVMAVPPPTTAPVANFVASPTSGNAPLQVTFTDQSTNNPTSWTWDFDNNGTTDSTTQSPTHTYNTSGTYSVKLTATNSAGSGTLTRASYITVSAPPAATYTFTNPTVDVSVSEGAIASFTVSTANVPAGTTLWWAAFGVNGATMWDASYPFPPLGSTTVNSMGLANISVTVATDYYTPELNEGFFIRVYTSEADMNAFVNHVAESKIAYMLNVPPTGYYVYPYNGVQQVQEGGSITFLIGAHPMGAGATVWWTTTGGNPAASPADVTSPSPPLGSVVLDQNGQANLTFVVKADSISEPAGEQFYVSIHPTQAERDSYTLNVSSVSPLATSPIITIYD